MANEIEVKLTYKRRGEIIAWLNQNGFNLAKHKDTTDMYFRVGASSMDDIDRFYRIREEKGEFVELTLKDSFQEKNGIKSRREINVKVDDSEKTRMILESLGCNLFKEHDSKREIWEKGAIKFELIDYYKPAKLGFIEIEGPSNESIQVVIKDLGARVEVAGNDLFSVFDAVK